MTQHDYKAALRRIHDPLQHGKDRYVLLESQQIDAIVHALKVAHKLMQEPSHSMSEEGQDMFQTACSSYSDIFKAMRDKMLKEVE